MWWTSLCYLRVVNMCGKIILKEFDYKKQHMDRLGDCARQHFHIMSLLVIFIVFGAL